MKKSYIKSIVQIFIRVGHIELIKIFYLFENFKKIKLLIRQLSIKPIDTNIIYKQLNHIAGKKIKLTALFIRLSIILKLNINY